MINKNRITFVPFLTCLIANILFTDLAAAAEREQRDFSSSDITKVLMLGTGTPVPNPEKRGPSIAVIVKGIPYIVDAGAGIWRAMGEEMPDVPMPGWKDRKPSKVKGFGLHKAVWKRVFLTHLHSDHTIGLPSLILSPWSWRREEPPHIYGPPGTKDLVLPPSSVATPCLNASVNWPACVGVHTKVSLNVRHRVVSPTRIAERTASLEIRLKL